VWGLVKISYLNSELLCGGKYDIRVMKIETRFGQKYLLNDEENGS